MRALVLLGLACVGPAPFHSAWASGLEVSFREGAPKDRFEIRNGACAIADAHLTIDLEGSAGRLVFDVTSAGAGVQVFQPFEVVAGRGGLSALPQVRDGDRSVTLPIARLDGGGTIAFTIDVDDTIAAREITVADGEIVGATVRLETGAGTAIARFESGPVATIADVPC